MAVALAHVFSLLKSVVPMILMGGGLPAVKDGASGLSIRGSNGFIQNHESGLERGELNKCLQGFDIDLSGLRNLLTSSPQAGEVEVCLGFSS